MGMTKEEAKFAAFATFGPKSEAIRVSSQDRSKRFVIAMGSYRVSRAEQPVPLLLGSGASWEEALDHARTTPNGQMAISEAQKVKDFVSKAMTSKTPGEFTDHVKEMSLQEARDKGFPQEAIDKLAKRFDDAKKKAIENTNDDNSIGTT